jgi:hypothetical protein
VDSGFGAFAPSRNDGKKTIATRRNASMNNRRAFATLIGIGVVASWAHASHAQISA